MWLKTVFMASLLLANGIAMGAKGSITAGKNKASTCVACHGEAGKSSVPQFPKLNGQHAEYILKQLKDFKSGKRKDPVMAPLVATLSEQDMQDLAAYYASQK